MKRQVCMGDFCPVFDNLQRPSQKIVGLSEGIKTVSCDKKMFNDFARISRISEESGARLRRILSD